MNTGVSRSVSEEPESEGYSVLANVCFPGGPQGQMGEWSELWSAQENVTLCGPVGRSTDPVVSVQLLFLEASGFNWSSLETLNGADVPP